MIHKPRRDWVHATLVHRHNASLHNVPLSATLPQLNILLDLLEFLSVRGPVTR